MVDSELDVVRLGALLLLLVSLSSLLKSFLLLFFVLWGVLGEELEECRS